jgi:uncharacterized membrane protein YraQ (UPF0718 family)
MFGALLSSCIHEFVPDRWTERFIKRSGFLSIPAAIIAAFLFPVCDCASVPVAARFARKGFPVQSVVVFMLASPIINPVVIASTWYAFSDYAIVGIRIALGIIIPVILGFFAWFFFLDSASIVIPETHGQGTCACHECASHGHTHEKPSGLGRIVNVLTHTGLELVSVIPYVIIGAIVSSAIQTFISPELFTGKTGGLLLQSTIMMGAAFFLSICSTSDAFFARAFLSHVSLGPAIGFMTAGPMVDAKNVLMMSSYFKKRFIIFIGIGVMVLVYASIFILSRTLLKV